jgi:hypothetical protein
MITLGDYRTVNVNGMRTMVEDPCSIRRRYRRSPVQNRHAGVWGSQQGSISRGRRGRANQAGQSVHLRSGCRVIHSPDLDVSTRRRAARVIEEKLARFSFAGFIYEIAE